MPEERTNTYADRPEVTIKFGKGLVGEPFMSKAGKELVEVKIPNPDPSDTRSWETFVVPKNFVHDNQYGKGVWMKLPEDGTTKLSRPRVAGQDENGRNIWESDTRIVPNTELKSLVESYKERSRGAERDPGRETGAAHVDGSQSGLEALAQKKSEAAGRSGGFVPIARDDEMPFR